MDVKTGCTVDVYAPEGFIKVLMRNVERLRGRGVQNFWGLAEIERAGDDGGGGIWTVRKSRPH